MSFFDTSYDKSTAIVAIDDGRHCVVCKYRVDDSGTYTKPLSDKLGDISKARPVHFRCGAQNAPHGRYNGFKIDNKKRDDRDRPGLLA